MMWDIVPPFALEWTAAVILVLIGAGTLRVVRERSKTRGRRYGAAAFRLLLITAVGVILLNPVGITPRSATEREKLVVLLDRSASMATEDVQDLARFTAACNTLETAGPVLESAFTVACKVFDRDAVDAAMADLPAMSPHGGGTELERALTDGVAALDNAAASAGILLISDGRATSGPPDAAVSMAIAESIPVWTWCLGGEVIRKDVRVEPAASEMLVFGKDRVALDVSVHQTGYPDRGFEIELLHDGAIIDSQAVMPVPDGAMKGRFEITAPEKGEHRYMFRVAPLAGEADVRNNAEALYLRVVGEKVKVLLAEGQPHWDTKFLVQMLKGHPRVDLTAVYRLGADRYSAVVSRRGEFERKTANLFPKTREALFDHDVLILGRQCEDFISRSFERAVTEFVSEQGGGIVFARAKPYSGRFSPLAKLEPVVWAQGTAGNVHVRLTNAAWSHPVFTAASIGEPPGEWLGRMPPPSEVLLTSGKKPLAHVLADTDAGAGPDQNTILMASQRYGQGKAVTLNMNGMWQWAFQLRSDDAEADQFERFWMSLLRWLLEETDFLPGEDVSLHIAGRRYTDSQRIRMEVMTRGLPPDAYHPVLEITGPGYRQRLEPARGASDTYAAAVGPLDSGTYDVVLRNNVGTPETIRTTIEVAPPGDEFKELSADPDAMRRIAEATGARMLSAADIAELPEVIRQWRLKRQVSTEHRALWDHWGVLLLVMVLMGAEWYVRRRDGLL